MISKAFCLLPKLMADFNIKIIGCLSEELGNESTKDRRLSLFCCEALVCLHPI